MKLYELTGNFAELFDRFDEIDKPTPPEDISTTAATLLRISTRTARLTVRRGLKLFPRLRKNLT